MRVSLHYLSVRPRSSNLYCARCDVSVSCRAASSELIASKRTFIQKEGPSWPVLSRHCTTWRTANIGLLLQVDYRGLVVENMLTILGAKMVGFFITMGSQEAVIISEADDAAHLIAVP